ncbi:MAG: septum site-determining protein MinC [Gomphosphaeria aponina SAG 52.96 = DSM 107014]|uniref:Probable septum site-determining protein MinC n=1 Tax=Gomphosphaeria aponina SAG 52.96 = DSM 107014 TaxID=1521640 RepID=A0A941GW94_9CHRO|nr:septum site-determining protein MinC [Gomphosphaeria aponina SAG 52.96 = DSM 107014]
MSLKEKHSESSSNNKGDQPTVATGAEAGVSRAGNQVNEYSQVSLKSEGEKVLLILPTSGKTEQQTDWSVLWQDLKYRLQGSEHAWQAGTAVHLLAKDRLLDGRQLQTIAETLKEVKLQLKWVCTSRRQTAVAAATAGYSVQQEKMLPAINLEVEQSQQQQLAEPLYLQTTVRSGSEVRHPGTIIIQGDCNPGGIIIAAGDILVWGSLRGIAHAGAMGNREAKIMALRMEPTQLRIADLIARAPESPPSQLMPEVAYITPEGIRIAQTINFAKNNSFLKKFGPW